MIEVEIVYRATVLAVGKVIRLGECKMLQILLSKKLRDIRKKKLGDQV